MVGVTRIGTYFPRRRLPRALVADAWGGRAAAGTRTVAAIDEDALTMAVEAVGACLDRAAAARVDALYFASTSSPYLEKQVASVVATAADLPRALAAADFTGSVRAGVSALRGALDAVRAGSVREAVVVAADARLAEPGGELEPVLGDGAAAVGVGADGVIAELVGAAAVAEEFTYLWRTDRQHTVQVAEPRFGATYGYARDVAEAIGAALGRAGISAGQVATLALGAPDERAAADVAKRVGCDPRRQLAPAVAAEAGVLGTPEPFVLLARALETAGPGDVIVVAGHGEGADALVFRATERLPAARPRPVAERLARGVEVPSYARYLRGRGLLPAETVGETVTSVIEWKELAQDIRLHGSRCEACGLVQYPQTRVCLGCEARDRLVAQPLARRGTVFTFTIDHLAQVPEPPLPMAVIDLDGGGRVYLQVTDAAADEVRVGTPVALSFRRLGEAGGNRNYFWKARPLA